MPHNTTPTATIVITSQDREDDLLRAVRSALNQTAHSQILIIDDGYTDGTWDYLQTLAPPIRSFHQENKGSGAPRNLGAQHATGTYLAFLDSHDKSPSQETGLTSPSKKTPPSTLASSSSPTDPLKNKIHIHSGVYIQRLHHPRCLPIHPH